MDFSIADVFTQWSEIDDTTKLFMTGRSDPRAFFQPTYACNPDTDELQIELTLVGRQYDPPGGVICVRESFDNSHEFRYSPPGNTRTLTSCHAFPSRTHASLTFVNPQSLTPTASASPSLWS